MTRRTRIAIVAIPVLLALGATRAAAQNPFAIDGAITDANNSGVALGAFKTIDANSNAKELGPLNSATTKIGVINSDAPATLGDTNPNAQVDLNTVYTQSAIAGADLWFYFGWVRDSTNGSGFISIELQRNAPPVACNYAALTEAQLIAGCNPWSGRQNGDFILLWDQQGGSTAISYRIYNATLGAFEPPIAIPVNIGIAVYGAGDTSRGEVAVNISAIVSGQAQRCLSFANIIPGTVTGNSDSADYKDAVLSLFPAASNCGSVTVNKVTQNGAGTVFTGTGPFPYTLTAGTTPIFDTVADSDCAVSTDVNSCTGSLAQGGSSNTISELLARTDYTLSEGAIGAQWELVSIVCGGATVTNGATFAVPAGGTTACTITNKLKQGKLLVKKQVINDNGGTANPADFTLDIGVAGVNPFSGDFITGTEFTLNDGVSFSVTEVGLAGYDLTSAVGCTGSIVANTTKECTLVNNDQPPSLSLVKIVENTAGGNATAANFTLTATGASTFSGPGPTVNSGATFLAGAYTLSESEVAGYTVKTNWTCSFGTSGGSLTGSSVTLGIGQTATCTIVNQDSKASPTGATVQRVILHDTMTLTGIRPGAPVDPTTNPAATVTFRLFPDATCAAQTQVGVDEVRPVVNGSATTVVGSIAVTVSGTYYWTATYSGDAFNNPVTKGCGSETTAVTFVQ